MNNFTDKEWQDEIDRVWRESGQGEIYKAVGNTYYGINHRGTGQPIPNNHDQHGLTFFTRPNLNLSYDNIKAERILLPLLDKRPNSMYRAIRMYLDPDAHDLFSTASGPLKSTLLNPKFAFIPLLSNNLLSMSGWPDIALDPYVSKEGRAREAWSMGDGITRNFQVMSMSASFRNMIGDPITLMFFYWVNYISLVYQGRISPKPECIVENEIDYMTRIYRLVLDPTRRFVKKISACGAAFPLSAPIGASHNFAIEAPTNKENDQITINFQMIGIEYLDPILITEFNRTLSLFNNDFSTENSEGSPNFTKASYVKLVGNDLNTFNNKGYPWINPFTYELEWYIEKEVYTAGGGVLPPPPGIAAQPKPTANPKPTIPNNSSTEGLDKAMKEFEVTAVVEPATTQVAASAPPPSIAAQTTRTS